MSKSVLPMFSTRRFIESCIAFMFLIHFYFIFVYGIRERSKFIDLHDDVQLFPKINSVSLVLE